MGQNNLVRFENANKFLNFWRKYAGLIKNIILVALCFSLILYWQYIPLLFFDELQDKYAEKVFSNMDNLTLFYPSRVVIGNDYQMKMVLDLPEDQFGENEFYEFTLTPNWAGVNISPKNVKFENNNSTMKTIDMEILNSPPPDNVLEIAISSNQYNRKDDIDISIYNVPEYVEILKVIIVASFSLIIFFNPIWDFFKFIRKR